MAERPFEIKIQSHPLSLVQDAERVRLAQRGEICHRALSLLDHSTGRGAIEQAILRAFALEGGDQARWDIEKEFLGPLQAALSLAEVRPWFAPGVKNLREAEVIDAHGELLRIDRIIIAEDRLQVIDFKVAQRSEGHRAQVGLYRRLAEAVFRLPAEGYLLYIDEPAVVAVP
jgi:ATP-dependent exoDNAse (exonuclease V) beta subunit